MDSPTLQVDKVFHKSALTGVCFDTRKSSLDLYKTHIQLVTEINEKERQLIQHGKTLTNVKSQINQIVSNMRKSGTIEKKNKAIFDKLKADIRFMKEEVVTLGRSHHPEEKTLTGIDSNLKSLQSTKRSLSNEIQQNLLGKLSVTDQRKEELEVTLQETLMEDRGRKLDNSNAELPVINNSKHDVNKNFNYLEQNMKGSTQSRKMHKRNWNTGKSKKDAFKKKSMRMTRI
ncbi:structural maintenance of chromosomes protein 3 [Nephila pilipes]|uniref:Structural maintenance of chromosomes protein 3 n=1 Tax=Nephila pilipes TaxID=299642 RepID=A0A8X6NCH8_NEPPI|nr:structural maintenance of chromosomes protein 3 [Nephila pilipes]